MLQHNLQPVKQLKKGKMKYVIITVLVLSLGLLGVGFYLKNTGDSNGEMIIGFGVLSVAFILMPLFIYHRYKNKNLSDFKFENFRKDLEERSKNN